MQSEELAEDARAGDTLVLRMQGKELAAKDGTWGGLDREHNRDARDTSRIASFNNHTSCEEFHNSQLFDESGCRQL